MKEILLSSIAQKQFGILNKTQKEHIKSALKIFASEGRGDVKKLKGTKGREALYRLRVGEYRIIFAKRDEKIFITQIISRSQGYDWL